MKKVSIIAIAMLVSMSISAKQKVWESQDETSMAVAYEFNNRAELWRAYGIGGWDKDAVLWQKKTAEKTILVTRTTDKKWSAVEIKTK